MAHSKLSVCYRDISHGSVLDNRQKYMHYNNQRNDQTQHNQPKKKTLSQPFPVG